MLTPEAPAVPAAAWSRSSSAPFLQHGRPWSLRPDPQATPSPIPSPIVCPVFFLFLPSSYASLLGSIGSSNNGRGGALDFIALLLPPARVLTPHWSFPSPITEPCTTAFPAMKLSPSSALEQQQQQQLREMSRWRMVIRMMLSADDGDAVGGDYNTW